MTSIPTENFVAASIILIMNVHLVYSWLQTCFAGKYTALDDSFYTVRGYNTGYIGAQMILGLLAVLGNGAICILSLGCIIGLLSEAGKGINYYSDIVMSWSVVYSVSVAGFLIFYWTIELLTKRRETLESEHIMNKAKKVLNKW
jgi:hypothetical protein